MKTPMTNEDLFQDSTRSFTDCHNFHCEMGITNYKEGSYFCIGKVFEPMRLNPEQARTIGTLLLRWANSHNDDTEFKVTEETKSIVFSLGDLLEMVKAVNIFHDKEHDRHILCELLGRALLYCHDIGDSTGKNAEEIYRALYSPDESEK